MWRVLLYGENGNATSAAMQREWSTENTNALTVVYKYG